MAATLTASARGHRRETGETVGAVLVADLVGFTPLTRAVSQLGPRGVEALHAWLDETFSRLGSCVAREGGIVSAFAGDAITAVFGGPDAPARARAAAERMQAAMTGVHLDLTVGMSRAAPTPTQPRLRVGVAAGRAERTTLTWEDPAGAPLADDPRATRERRRVTRDVVWGDALTAAALAQTRALPGGIEVVAEGFGAGQALPEGLASTSGNARGTSTAQTAHRAATTAADRSSSRSSRVSCSPASPRTDGGEEPAATFPDASLPTAAAAAHPGHAAAPRPSHAAAPSANHAAAPSAKHGAGPPASHAAAPPPGQATAPRPSHAAAPSANHAAAPPPGQATAPRPSHAAAPRGGAEHRVVTTVFVTLGPTADGVGPLAGFLPEAAAVIDRCGGHLRQIDGGGPRFQLVLGFGAPRARPDDAAAAVSCARQLVDAARAAGFDAAAGIATGAAFCAELGSPDHREYVVVGATVNLAARLASAAARADSMGPDPLPTDTVPADPVPADPVPIDTLPLDTFPTGPLPTDPVPTDTMPTDPAPTATATGTAPTRSVPTSSVPTLRVWMDAETAQRCDAALRPLAIRRDFKGVGELTVYAVGAVASGGCGVDVAPSPEGTGWAGRAGAPFVGRTTHQRLVAALARRAARGHGAALLVVGDPGIGKTALLDAVCDALPAREVVRTDVPLPGDIRPYLPWRPVWRELLFDGRTPDVAAIDDAAAATGLPELAPLLDAPLGVTGRAAGKAHAWDPQDRARATSHVLSALFAARARPGSVVVVDDAHRFDGLSTLLLLDLMARSPALPLLVLVGTRPDAPIASAAEAASVVRLDGLSPDDSRGLARLWGHGGLSGGQLSDAIARSGGNPLMLKHLLSCAADPVPPWGSDPTLPLDVRRLVLARVDGLLGDDQLLLRAAAVIGPQFTDDMLSAVTDRFGGVPDVHRELRRLAEVGLLTRGEGAGHRFADALVREVVYAAASLSERARLHGAVARHLEAGAAQIEDLADAAEDGAGGRERRRRTGFGLGADERDANERDANELDANELDAAGRDNLRRDAGRDNLGRDNVGRDNLGRDNVGRDNVGRDNVGRDNVGRDNVGRDNVGRDNVGRDNKRDDTRRDNPERDVLGRDLADRHPVGLGTIRPDASRPDATRQVHPDSGGAAGPDATGPEAGSHGAGVGGTRGGPRAELVDLLAYHYGRSADVAKQREWVGAAARAAELSYATGAALDYLAHLETIARGAERAGLLVRRGAVLALVARWADAEAVLREAIRAADHEGHGDPAVAADARRELGSLLVATTRFGEAITLLTDAAEQLRAAGDLAGAARALDRLAFARFQHGDIDAAAEAAMSQVELATALEDDALIAAAHENIALTAAARGERTEALRGLRRAHRIARRLGDPRLIVHVSNDLAGVYAQAGDDRRATTWLRRALRAASVIGYDRATAYLTANLGELSRAAGDLDGARAHYVAALRTALAIGDWVTTTQCTTGLAICAARQQHRGHRRLLAQARTVAESLHPAYVLDELERCERELATHGAQGGPDVAEPAGDPAVETLFAQALAARASH